MLYHTIWKAQVSDSRAIMALLLSSIKHSTTERRHPYVVRLFYSVYKLTVLT